MENMAAGRMMFNCSQGQFADIVGESMYGLQTFENPPTNNAGSLEVIAGCTDCAFGNAICYDNDKPVRYLSVATGTSNNSRCSFGSTSARGRTGSSTAHALAIRSAVDCTFGRTISVNGTLIVNVGQEAGDSAYSVDRNYIEAIIGNVPSTGASVDAALEHATALTSAALGTLSIGCIDSECNGEHGLLVTSGTVNVATCRLIGGSSNVRLVVVSATTGTASLNIGTLAVSQGSTATASPVNVGNGGVLRIGHSDILRGPTATATTAAIRYDSSFGTGSIGGAYLGTVRYRQNGTAFNYLHVVTDTTNGFESWIINDIDGSGSSGQARFGADTFSILNNRISSTVIPTSGTYSQGAVLWNTNAAAGGSPGWVCTTGGTSGTWKAMANLAP